VEQRVVWLGELVLPLAVAVDVEQVDVLDRGSRRELELAGDEGGAADQKLPPNSSWCRKATLRRRR
jgi:hypothetical protein